MTTNEVLKIIGHNISKIRKEKFLKGETLAKELGVSKSAISHFENGLVDLKISTLHQIATVLKTDLSHLFESEEAADNRDAELSQYREQVNKQIRVIDMLVCRIEYMNEQIECLKIKKVV